MQNASHSAPPCFGHHRPRVVFGITGMHHNRAVHLSGQHELLRECVPLLEARRVVVVIVQPAFANGDRTVFDERQELPDMRCVIESRRIVRMHAG